MMRKKRSAIYRKGKQLKRYARPKIGYLTNDEFHWAKVYKRFPEF
jgi:hypothetical protein